ncbi:MAG: ABC transporter permease [Bacteroidetes bacterium]|nr:MAG: ABC transporter permease [Bacteroidota bacterium]
MIRNYIKVAFRNLRKNKGYSAINILGLAVGMAVAMLIGLWIWDEVSYNKSHENYDRIAQLMTTQTFNGEIGTGPAVSVAMGMELRARNKDDFKYVALSSWNFGHILAVGEKKISSKGMWVQPEFPEIFTLEMIKGSRSALQDPTSILLTQSLAKSLFGNTDPINKIIKVDNKIDLKVGGVYKDFPHNTTLYDSKFYIPWEKYKEVEPWVKESETQWGNHSFQLFVLMQPHVDFDKTTKKIKDIPKQHVNEGKEEVVLFPMDKWHLHSEFKNGKIVGGKIQFVWLFAIIGVFVLLLACINFMNLSTARSEKRAKEVGIRKAVGSYRRQLVGQFLSESLVVALLAFVLSIILVLSSLHFFNSLANKQMKIPWGNPYFWGISLGFTLFTGLISGSYPALYLSGFNAVRVLKGTFKAGRWAAVPRKVLVVVQFTVSIALIIGTIIVFRQIEFAKDRPVGYSREGMFTVMINTPELYGHYNALRDDLLRTGVVENMAESSSPSTGVWSNQIGFDWKGKDPTTTPLFGTVACTHDFGSTLHWKIKEGRDFSRQFVTDSLGMIMNESAVKLIGLKNLVGETIKWNDKDYHVVGIVKDMIMESPYEPIKPTIFFISYGWTSVITVRVKPSIPMRNALAKVEPVFKTYNPGSPFEYKFVDEDYAEKFSDEERIGNLATFFAILAIFISSLGLFGLASFVAEQRTKEIGVRKVLGASVFHVWQMLSKDFLILVAISCLIAIPIAWYYLSHWLERYHYRTTISWWVFVVAALGSLAVTIATISFQAIRAAVANPVKSLRTE